MLQLSQSLLSSPNMGKDFRTSHYVNRAIDQAARILEKIDKRWPE